MYYVCFKVFLILCWFLLSRLLYGRLQSMRANKLKKEDIEKIKANGISHNTSNENYKKIIESKMIRGRRGLNAYS